MSAALLTTKLNVPPLRPNLVARPHLVRRLDEGLLLGRGLTLLSAPPGFGKTTLITEWLSQLDRPATWLSLEEEDNDPAQFLGYLVAALQQVDKAVGQTVQQLAQSPQIPPPAGLITPLINDVTSLGVELVLVLDDFHRISSVPVHAAIEFLLEHLPPSMHVVICTRKDPPLPLARMRARGQVTEIRERDLRFTDEEAAVFLRKTMGRTFSPDAVKLLKLRTEGWVTGLQLAALTMQEGYDDTSVFVAAFRGDNRYIVDYLVSEVIQRQPAPVSDFLRQTAILDRLNAELCNAVTGREDSQALLEQLEAANLFLVPLDRRREWYRYHQLFADVLRAKLDEQERKPLHRRAMRWYETRGFFGQAVRHALAYVSLSGDLEAIEGLMRTAIEETIHGGGVMTVRSWLEAVPDDLLRRSAELTIYKGWVLLLTGELPLAESYADAGERRLDLVGSEAAAPPAGEASRGKLQVLRAHIRLIREDYAGAIDRAADALRILEEGHPRWRIAALWAKAESLERAGAIAEAIETFREAERTGRIVGSEMFLVFVDLSLPLSLHCHGKRREAVAFCEEAVARYTDQRGRLSPVAGLVLSRLGMLHYEANQLQLARECHDRGLALAEQLALEHNLFFAYGLSAPTLHAQGETEAALERLQKAYQSAGQMEYAATEGFQAWEVNIRLQQGNLPFAQRWAEGTGLSPDSEPEYLRLDAQVTFGRVLIALGRLSEARRWLARLETFSRRGGLFRFLITVHVLQALVAEKTGDRSSAVDFLAQAVQIAAPEGFVRAFLEEGEQALALLPQVRHVAPAFVDELLRAGEGVLVTPPVGARPLAEPLSEREIEVLRLIATGLSNREIASRLVVALSTVKTHINNAYGKLSVRSRTQAVARARELGLLR